MKNKKVIIYILTAIVFIGISSLIGWNIYKTSIVNQLDITFNKDVEVEYGSSVNSKILVDSYNGDVKHFSLESNTVGEVTVSLEASNDYGKKMFSTSYQVKDTVMPTIELNEQSTSIPFSADYNILENVKKASDSIDGDFKYLETPSKEDVGYYTYNGTIDSKKAGEYSIEYTVVDLNGNETKTTLKVTVEEEITTTNTSITNYTPVPTEITKNKVIVIDAGHQAYGNYDKEPIGPGATTTKAKVSTGTTGVVTGIPESIMVLEVSLKLEEELKQRGYQVIMIRRSQDVDISNAERAKIANESGASAFIRIHGNGLDDSSVHGAFTMAPASDNPYVPQNIISPSYSLSSHVIEGLVDATGAKNRGVVTTNTMSGINWCTVPVTIVEMGFMSNPEEDRLLNDDEYQTKLAIGMANGIDSYISE